MDFLIPLFNTLAIAAILISLLVGLFTAPWQLLLVILLTGLWLTQRLLQDNARRGLSDGGPTFDLSQLSGRR